MMVGVDEAGKQPSTFTDESRAFVSVPDALDASYISRDSTDERAPFYYGETRHWVYLDTM
jgi:hypothetical protein